MKISAIIPVYGEEELINGAVAALKKTAAGASYEIIVADGAPGHGTLNAIRDAGVIKVAAGTGRGLQMNRGAARASGDVMLFLHADTRLPENAFDDISNSLSDERFAGGAFRLAISSQNPFLTFTAWTANLRSKLAGTPFGDQAIFLRQKYFQKIGGFREIPIMEDLELMKRIRRSGGRIKILGSCASTSARRWEREGVLYTTLRNKALRIMYTLGAAPETLVKYYGKESGKKPMNKFERKLKSHRSYPLRAGKIEIFQMNVGKLCNLSCEHCHVEAGPGRKEIMPRSVFEKCLEAVKSFPSLNTIDITGGSPEMNPELEWFINALAGTGRRIIVRTNLAILLEKEYSKFIGIYADNGVELCASLPCYGRENVDKQRGEGIYGKSIKALKMLNKRGYGGKDSGLILNLVYNPGGANLPSSQSELELDYKTSLKREHGIVFNKLFCLANMPIGRYLDYLESTDNMRGYMKKLADTYNPLAVPGIMCKRTISVSWDGKLYDCDFNQMLGLGVSCRGSRTVDDFNPDELRGREIVTNIHCYGCTAGAGSSCTGSIG